MSTVYDICSAALIGLGKNSIQRFREGRREAEVASIIYPMVKQDEQSNHFWNFNQAVVVLSQETMVPVDPNWRVQYLPPSDMLRLAGCMDSRGEQCEYEDATGR